MRVKPLAMKYLPINLVRRIKAYNAISRLDREGSNALRSLATVFEETLRDDATPEERAWIDAIEALRTRLNASSTELSVVDYGAGAAGLRLTNQEMYQGRIVTRVVKDICKASKPYLWSFLLFKLLRKRQPAVCLELGTCLGISACFQAAALKLNQTGRIVTLEGAESVAALAKANFEALNLDNVTVVVGRFQDTLSEVLQMHEPLDYAFIDGHHDEEATLTYFEQIVSRLSKKALLVFDDIAWSEGMKRAWEIIASDGRVRISIDLRAVGICIMDSGIQDKRDILIPL